MSTQVCEFGIKKARQRLFCLPLFPGLGRVPKVYYIMFLKLSPNLDFHDLDVAPKYFVQQVIKPGHQLEDL